MTFIKVEDPDGLCAPRAVFIDPLQKSVTYGLEALKTRIRVSRSLGYSPIEEEKALVELEAACVKWDKEKTVSEKSPIAA